MTAATSARWSASALEKAGYRVEEAADGDAARMEQLVTRLLQLARIQSAP